MQTSKSQYQKLLEKIRKPQLQPRTYEQGWRPITSGNPSADIILAARCYWKLRKSLYINYMEDGFRLFKSCLDPISYQKYTQEEYPDVCTCGNKLSSSGSILRNHCQNCHGKSWTLGYEIQRFEKELDIHYSWLEFAFANAIWLE